MTHSQKEMTMAYSKWKRRAIRSALLDSLTRKVEDGAGLDGRLKPFDAALFAVEALEDAGFKVTTPTHSSENDGYRHAWKGGTCTGCGMIK